MLKEKWRKQTIKLLTILIVLMLLMTPETIHLGLFIDAVGIDTLFILLEVQVVSAVVLSYQGWLKPSVIACCHFVSQVRKIFFTVPTNNIAIACFSLIAGGIAFLVFGLNASNPFPSVLGIIFIVIGSTQAGFRECFARTPRRT